MEEQGEHLLKSDEIAFNTTKISNSSKISALLLLNSMIGSGILSQPYVFMKSGILGGLFCFVVTSLFTWSGVMLLTLTGIHYNILEYSGLAKKAFGIHGQNLLDFGIAISAFGCQLGCYCFVKHLFLTLNAGYMIVIGETTSQLLGNWGCIDTICDQMSVTIITTIGFILPVCMFRHFGHLAWLSVFSVFAIVLCVGLVLIGGPLTTQHVDKAPVKIFDTLGMLKSTGSVVFALGCATGNFQAYIATDEKSQNQTIWAQVTGSAVLMGAALCITMGICKFSGLFEIFISFIHGTK
jgi:amino acid permease